MKVSELPKQVEIDGTSYHCGAWHTANRDGTGTLGAGLFESQAEAERCADPYTDQESAERSWGLILSSGEVYRTGARIATVEMPGARGVARWG